MLSFKTKVNSQGEKQKKFKMPKFPSAVVILFLVLVFVILLSWIPHKGWVDVSTPLLLFKDEGIYGQNGTVLWGSYSMNGDSFESIGELQIDIKLNDKGQWALLNFLVGMGVLAPDADISVPEAVANTVLAEATINNIVLDPKFYQSSINYSNLTFDLVYGGKTFAVSIDRIFQVGTASIGDDGELIGTFGIVSGEMSNEAWDEPFSFIASNGKNNFFNFWNTNYYMGDINGTYGLLNIPFIILAGFFNATGVIMYLFCIGAFIEVMLQSGSLEAGTSSLVKTLNGRELLLVPILFVLFCVGGTMYGMQEETLGLLPLIVPFLVLAGFDTMTGLIVVVVGTTSGIAASVTDPFSVGVMSGALQVPEAKDIDEPIELAIATGIVIRIIMFLVFAVVGALFSTWYGWRAKKGIDHVAEPTMYEENRAWAQEMLGEAHAAHTGLTKRQMAGLLIFGGTFCMMIFVLLPWTSWFPNLGGDSRGFWFMFSSLFYSGAIFGEWYFVQLGCMFIAISLILGRVFGMKQKDTNKAMVSGMKGMFGIAMILTISRSVSLVLSYSGLTTAMIAMMFGGAGVESGEFSGAALVWILLPIFAFLSVFIPSTSGLAGITGPIIGPIIWTIGGPQNYAGYAALVIAVYPLGQGIINMCSPTTGLVVAQAEISRVNFGKAFPILAGCAVVTALLGMLVISCAAPIVIDPVAAGI